MTKQHACPRCGYETRYSHGGWADRHPAAAVTAGLFTLTLMSMMLSVHPIAGLTLIALGGVGGVGYLYIRRQRRDEALSARADYENRALMNAPLPPVRPLPQRQTHSLPWRMVRLLRTEPMRAVRR